jgi:hypothetical protein
VADVLEVHTASLKPWPEAHGGEAPPIGESSTAKAQHTHQRKRAAPGSTHGSSSPRGDSAQQDKLIIQPSTICNRGGLMSSLSLQVQHPRSPFPGQLRTSSEDMSLAGQAWHADIGAASWVRFLLEVVFFLTFGSGPARSFRFSAPSGFDHVPAPGRQTIIYKEIRNRKCISAFGNQFHFTTHISILLLFLLPIVSITYYIYISNFIRFD